MSDLSVVDYSEKAIVVRGDTKAYKTELASLGGKYNGNLKDGPGWIFSKKNEEKVKSFIAENKGSKRSKSTDSDLTSLIETKFRKMDLKQRIAFIAQVTRLASTVNVDEPVKQVEKPMKEKSFDITNSDVEEDEDDEDEDKTQLRLMKT